MNRAPETMLQISWEIEQPRERFTHRSLSDAHLRTRLSGTGADMCARRLFIARAGQVRGKGLAALFNGSGQTVSAYK